MKRNAESAGQLATASPGINRQSHMAANQVRANVSPCIHISEESGARYASLNQTSKAMQDSRPSCLACKHVPYAIALRNQPAIAVARVAGGGLRPRRDLFARFVGGDGVRAAMKQERFEVPLTVKSGDAGENLVLRTARDASDYLLNKWPGKKSPKHRAALQACHDAIAGDKPAMTARRAFLAAAREADVLVSDKVP